MGSNFEDDVQKRLDAAMPWVGLYIAVASAVCTLAMAADAFNGFRRKKLWFPCKYFSLNAISLTLLAVVMKLPVDLNTNMFKSNTDMFAKFFSLIFMCTAMANFMSSLGSMTDKEVFANVVALGILAITITGNVCIQLIRLAMVDYLSIIFCWIPTTLMLLLLATLVSMAITVPTAKKTLESRYQEKHRKALREEEVLKRREAFQIDEERGHMMKYFVMAETSSPQFVMARSVVSTTAAVICWLAAIILAAVHILIWIFKWSSLRTDSSYGNYTKWILFVQSTGVAIGIIAPTLRWFIAVIFKCSMTERNSFKKEFKIEAYWIQTLLDWRESFSALQIQQNKCRKYLHNLKWFTLTFCIGIQVLIVLVSKLLVFLSASILTPIFLCFTHIKKFLKQKGHKSGGDRDLNLGHYVLLLEGEAELPRRVLKNICRDADNLIKTGRNKQPQSLIDLLDKFIDFNGVGEFESNQIQSLHSEEPPDCWMLPVVTLTSIAIALPNNAKHKCKQLLSGVAEGLSLAKIIEKNLVKNAEIVNIRKASDVCWVSVLLYMKWLDVDLTRTSLKSKTSKAVLQELSYKAKGIIMDFKREATDSLMENPLNWPAKVVIANSMYRISQTLLLSCNEEESEHTDEGFFERISVMIADILAACLTNLPHAITTMCHHNAIEKREKSVRKAFLLLGKTEQVVKLLQRQEWPSLDHEKATSIEEWRAWFQHLKDDPATLSSSTEAMTARASSGEVYIDC